ncbi:MAG: alpha/beta hydrolase [Novosphingobium sp.]|nr:alpha/beta hydrolase [Novosphingobium sp.]
MTATRHHKTARGLQIAYRHCEGEGPVIVFLPGYMSDMAGGKAGAVFDWAERNGRACLLLDYSGCGESEGDFAQGTLSLWRSEVLELIESHCGEEQVLLIGSSMGGWLMLLVALALPPERRAGLIGIAAAPDFTDWGRKPDDKQKLMAGETVYDANPYGPEPTPMHPLFWEDGQANRLLDREIPIDCPVRLIHGQLDRDVPWDTSLRLMTDLRASDVRVTLIKDGDHRLSRPRDIALLLRTISGFSDA